MIAAAALRADAVDEDGLEALVPFDGTGPIAEEPCGFATPRHRALIPLICGSGKPLGLVVVDGPPDGGGLIPLRTLS